MVKKLVDSSPFFTDTQCKVIHNGIDLHTYYHYDRDNIKKLYGLEGKKVIIGVANGWEKRKGLEYMKYLSIHLDENCVVVVVGLDREEEGFRSDTIIISKTTDITEMAKLYSMADVFVNPTLEDNYPTTNLEALACGTPVVTFNTGGSPESIQEGCGIVVKKKDGEELKKAVEKIISMNISPETCVKKAQEFDQEKVFAKYVCLYNSMGESD